MSQNKITGQREHHPITCLTMLALGGTMVVVVLLVLGVVHAVLN